MKKFVALILSKRQYEFLRFIRRYLTYIFNKLVYSRSMEGYFELKNKELNLYVVNDDYDIETIHKMHNKILNYTSKLDGWYFDNEKKKENLMILNDIKNGKLDDYTEEVLYIKNKKKLVLYPYKFVEYYDINNIKVYEEENYEYFIHNGRKLYFPIEASGINKQKYHQLIVEQDIESPHKYFEEKVYSLEWDVFVDVGCAEGNIALEFVDKCKDVYLFESDERWIGALKNTFNPWKDKVHYVRKFVSCYIDDNTVTLDEILKNYVGKKILIKMDLEGMEMDALIGLRRTINNNDCCISCTTYHNNSSYFLIKKFLERYGYEVSTTNGYMLFIYGYLTFKNGKYEKMQYPYFRKGIIRGISKHLYIEN